MLPYQKWVFESMLSFMEPKDKVFLEVGGVPNHQTIARNLIDLGAKEVVQINNRTDLPDSESSGVKYIAQDARKTTFPDESFDAIFSASVLEHLLDLEHFLGEMHRLLKKGGILCLHGGAMWNSNWGHHVWVRVDGASYEFNAASNPIPDWAHIYMTREEMLDHLTKNAIPPTHAEKICDWVYKSDQINRLIYDDYVDIFNISPFQIVRLASKDWKIPSEEIRQKISLKFVQRKPAITNFSIGETLVVLRK